MELQKEIEKRRTFAIISHPDAGKTTLTEKMLLIGGAIQAVGVVKYNKVKQHAASDFKIGSLQFDEIRFRPRSLYNACWIEAEDQRQLEAFLKRRGADIAWDKDGRPVFLAESKGILNRVMDNYPQVQLHFLSEKNLESISQ